MTPSPGHLPLPPILPAGTKVVARSAVTGPHNEPLHPAGSVAVIIASPLDPTHTYRVRFTDGGEASLKREDLVVLKHYQRDGVGFEAPVAEYDYRRHVILSAVVGS